MIEKKIDQIFEVLISEKKFEENGLLTGKTGIGLFYVFYSKFVKDEEIMNEGIKLITETFEDIVNNKFTLPTFCDGIAGYTWALEFLADNKILDKKDIEEFLEQINEYLFNNMINYIKMTNYDYLHGGIGVGLYFLKQVENSKLVENYIIELIDNIEKISEIETDGSIKWKSLLDFEKNTMGYNLGLSHGLASIIAFLSKVYKKGIYKDKVKYLLEGAVKYLLKTKLETSKHKSYFTSWICNEELPSSSRLAWCYGDLGIAIAIYQAAKTLNNNEWEQIAIEIFLFASKRIDLQKELVFDAGICHGTSGIAHIFNRMYLYTNVIEFKEASEYWFEKTIEKATHKDGLAGFKAWHTEKNGGWVNEYGILEGIAGIGLALISVVSDIDPSWDECLLLS